MISILILVSIVVEVTLFVSIGIVVRRLNATPSRIFSIIIRARIPRAIGSATTDVGVVSIIVPKVAININAANMSPIVVI